MLQVRRGSQSAGNRGIFAEQCHRRRVRDQSVSPRRPSSSAAPIIHRVPVDATTCPSRRAIMAASPPGLGLRRHDRLRGLIHEFAQVSPRMDDLFGTHTLPPELASTPRHAVESNRRLVAISPASASPGLALHYTTYSELRRSEHHCGQSAGSYVEATFTTVYSRFITHSSNFDARFTR